MKTLEYAQQLIRFASCSRSSNVEISDYVQQQLDRQGCDVERLEYFDAEGTRKVSLVAKKGSGHGGLAYFGHTDVVPADPWTGPGGGPFQPSVHGGRLYGRGSCDMKGSVASMLAAAEQFPAARLQQPLYITCTADEEIGYGGAAQVAARSQLFREMVAHGSRGIVGEPTRLQVVHAHKGTYGFRVVSRGRAAHSSTREGLNANLAMIPFLAEMKAMYDATETDPAWQNAAFDPPTVSWNIGINDHTAAVNITPPQSVCTVYFRPMPGQDAELLLERARAAAARCGVEFHMLHAAPPLHVDPACEYVRQMLRLTGNSNSHTVSYGTDGCRYTELKQLVLLGPGDIAQAAHVGRMDFLGRIAARHRAVRKADRTLVLWKGGRLA